MEQPGEFEVVIAASWKPQAGGYRAIAETGLLT